MTSIEDITPENYHIHLHNILEIENRSFPSPWSQRAFIQEIENPISHIWVLLADNRLVGYICFWLFDREIQLINIAVHPDEKGKGLGHHPTFRKHLQEKSILTKSPYMSDDSFRSMLSKLGLTRKDRN